MSRPFAKEISLLMCAQSRLFLGLANFIFTVLCFILSCILSSIIPTIWRQNLESDAAHNLFALFVSCLASSGCYRISSLTSVLRAEFNQVVIFVRDKRRCHSLNKILQESKFPSIELHSDMPADERSVHIFPHHIRPRSPYRAPREARTCFLDDELMIGRESAVAGMTSAGLESPCDGRLLASYCK